jgi:copper ion binding protein
VQTTYTVPGISCSHCRWAINRKVKKVTGVSDVDVDVKAKEVTVSGAFDDAQVRDAIDDAGYDVA